MEFDAFISHSSKDKTAANAACAVLEAAGIRCWVAPRDIRPGQNYGADIIDAIDRCRVMVLIFSSNANDSQQVHREIERAVSKGVAIVPVRIEEVMPTKSMEYFLGAIHWLDAMTPPIETHLHRLAATVSAILQADGAQNGAASDAVRGMPAQGGKRNAGALSPHRENAPARWLLPALGGAVCIALVAAGVWFYQGRARPPAAASVPPIAPVKLVELVPESVPMISDRNRAIVRSEYLPAADHKALAISMSQIGFLSGQPDDETAKTAAVDNCKKATAAGGRPEQQCDLYAVGNTVVYAGGRPPLPPEPWLVRNPAVERPFAGSEMPLVNDHVRTILAKEYGSPGNMPKALALSPRTNTAYYRNQSGPQEAIRRALETCGIVSGVPCTIIAVDDRFVIAVPTKMTVTGFFHAETNSTLDASVRDQVARQLGNSISGWNAVASGARGRGGLALGAADEQAAIDGAMADCGKQDRDCRVIAIGLFAVEAQH